MKMHTLRLLAVSATYFALGSAFAADAVSTTGATTTAGTTGATPAAVPASRIASRFEILAGSPENAASLVNGLRSGGEITLAAPDAATGVVFTPTTRPMGYGTITRALSLAQRQLAAQGIAEPTPAQLNAALNGGPLTTVDGSGATRTVEMEGVLQLRSQGMGWGRIARQLAVSPGSRPTPAAAPATTATQAAIDLRGGSHRQGAVVAGDGAIMHGRTPGFSGAAQTRTEIRSHKPSQANSSAHVQSSRPSFVAHGSSTNSGNHGKNAFHAGGKGRL